MQTYRLERRLSHADVDFLGELKVAALLGLFEQAAIEASAALGFDPAWYTREGRVWIVHRTRVERFLPVGGIDSVEVETHIADFRRVRSLRHYRVRRESDVVAEATTDWVYCDVATGGPTRIPESMQRAFMDGEKAPLLARAPSPLANTAEPAVEMTLTVQPSHLDHMAHVNNAVYASFLEDGAFRFFAARGWPLQRMLAEGGALRMRWLDVEYLSDAQVDQQLHIRTWALLGNVLASADPPDGAQLLQSVTREDSSEVLRARTDWVWRRRPAVVGDAPSA